MQMFMIALLPALLAVQSPVPPPQARELLAVIEKSADDWNRGDIEAFLQSYEQSPDTTFVGTEVSKGTDEVLARYRRAYPDAARMGRVRFSGLEPRMLSPELAIVTGRFHLDRDEQHGGGKTGLLTLVMRKGSNGWRVIHDHTSAG